MTDFTDEDFFADFDAEFDSAARASTTIAIPSDAQMVTLHIHGKMHTKGDAHIYLLLNGRTSGYRSFHNMDGDAGEGKFHSRGMTLGRNGWYEDAHFSATLELVTRGGYIKTMSAVSTFAVQGGRILGYKSHGRLSISNQVTNVSVVPYGGSGRLSEVWSKIVVHK